MKVSETEVNDYMVMERRIFPTLGYFLGFIMLWPISYFAFRFFFYVFLFLDGAVLKHSGDLEYHFAFSIFFSAKWLAVSVPFAFCISGIAKSSPVLGGLLLLIQPSAVWTYYSFFPSDAEYGGFLYYFSPFLIAISGYIIPCILFIKRFMKVEGLQEEQKRYSI